MSSSQGGGIASFINDLVRSFKTARKQQQYNKNLSGNVDAEAQRLADMNNARVFVNHQRELARNARHVDMYDPSKMHMGDVIQNRWRYITRVEDKSKTGLWWAPDWLNNVGMKNSFGKVGKTGDPIFVDLETGDWVYFDVPQGMLTPEKQANNIIADNYARGTQVNQNGIRGPIGIVRKPGGSSNAAPYDPIAVRAEQMIRDMGGRRSHSAIPQAPQYQFASEPVLVPLSQPSPMPQAPQYQRSLEPTVQFPGEPPVPLNPRARPSVSIPAGGPIRRRRGARAVAQPEPFDYVSYLSNLASLRYNF